ATTRASAEQRATWPRPIARPPSVTNATRVRRPSDAESDSITAQLFHLGRREPHAVGIARIAEPRRGPLTAFPGAERPRGIERLEHEQVVVLERLAALGLGDEDLVELFSGAHPDVLDLYARGHALAQIHAAHARDLRPEDLAALHAVGAADRELHAVLETDPEPGHGAIGDLDTARRALGLEERDHAPAAADDVAVADDAEHGAARVAVGV